MKIFPHLFSKLFSQPLLLEESVRFSLESHLLRHMGMSHAAPVARDFGRPSKSGTNEEYLDYKKEYAETMAAWRIEQVYSVYGSVAVVKLDGVINKRISQMDIDCYGGADLDDFDSALSIAAADSAMNTVVLAINSPGGSVTGVPRSAARVAALAQRKQVFAYVDCMAYYAAYYIASQADQISAAPSATLGSIGVYLTLLDATRAAEMEGYKVDLITAGKYKAMGSPFRPLSSDERAMLQARVTGIHADFKTAVRDGRRRATEAGGHQSVLDSTMEGQSFNGKESVDNRLADELTNLTLDEFVTQLL